MIPDFSDSLLQESDLLIQQNQFKNILMFFQFIIDLPQKLFF